jgi:hypothetical protein
MTFGFLSHVYLIGVCVVLWRSLFVRNLANVCLSSGKCSFIFDLLNECEISQIFLAEAFPAINRAGSQKLKFLPFMGSFHEVPTTNQ